MKRFMACVGATVLGASFIGASVAHADQLADIKKRQTLVCGIVSNNPPFGFQNPETREIIGYDVDFCKGVAKQLGVASELKVLSLDARIPELTQGRIDILTASLTYNAQRAQQVDFSHMYFVSNEVIATSATGPYKTVNDLAGKRISTVKGSSDIPAVLKLLPTAQMVSYDDPPSAFMALTQRKVDGYVMSESIMRRFVDRLGANAKSIAILAPPIDRQYWGLGMKKGEPALVAAINQALGAMESSGQSQQIFDKWLGTASAYKMKRDFTAAPIPE
ncbi:ABC transporter substrate-binding protein [Pandoraea sp. ISTKB]|uniref:ABC transporter substrate-binding protein n=1 Tax=Pandoraea sp. ISTKB TaxID=1586708 RepID=UPI000847B78D|nr:ABC transporter substrate-binding protein [Pandoraea sp. ISTKB]ODP31634.1 cysteine ABC transporter substrate-binding protein [Pandoraea sp. ISTKB]